MVPPKLHRLVARLTSTMKAGDVTETLDLALAASGLE
jgi:hypothetical protein